MKDAFAERTLALELNWSRPGSSYPRTERNAFDGGLPVGEGDLNSVWRGELSGRRGELGST